MTADSDKGSVVLRSREARVVFFLVVLTFISRALFIYKNGMGDADSVAIAAAMARLYSGDADILKDAVLYGRQLNPGVYLLLNPFYRTIFNSPSSMIPFLNWLSVLTASLSVIPLYVLFRKVLDNVTSSLCILLVVFSPLVWEAGTYFHPIAPASFFLFLSIVTAAKISTSFKGILYYLATVIFATLSIITRVEVLIAVPAVLLYILLSRRRKSGLTIFMSVFLPACIIYIFAVSSIKGSQGLQRAGFIGYINFFTKSFVSTFSTKGLIRSVPWAVMGVGTGTILVCCISLLYLLQGRLLPRFDEYRVKAFIAAAVVWAIPFLTLWIWQPVPILRHYFLAVPALVLIAGFYLQQVSRRRLVLLVTFVFILNLALPEFMYRGYNSAHPGKEKEPHGAFFYYHERNCRRIARYLVLQKEVIQSAESSRKTGSTDTLLVPANWEMFAYLLYGMAQTGELERLPDGVSARGFKVRNYRLHNLAIRIERVPVFSFRVIPEVIGDILSEAAMEGYRVVVPVEVLEEADLHLKPLLKCETY